MPERRNDAPFSLTGIPRRVPVRVGLRIGDSLAFLHGVIGVLTALRHREVNGGAGQVIDVALYEAVFNMMESLLPEYDAFDVVRERTGSALPGMAPTNAYPCKNGEYVLITGNSDRRTAAGRRHRRGARTAGMHGRSDRGPAGRERHRVIADPRPRAARQLAVGT